jgi:hypothetical protein
MEDVMRLLGSGLSSWGRFANSYRLQSGRWMAPIRAQQKKTYSGKLTFPLAFLQVSSIKHHLFPAMRTLIRTLLILTLTPLLVMADPAQRSEEFLKENAKKEGVKTLPDGLQYKVLKEGAGKTPSGSDVVSVHYRGTLVDGTEFDSSYKRGQPIEFPVNGVIKGWTEALQLMKEGSKWMLFIPSKLAYGERGVGPIGPNEALIFEVELLKVK